MEDNMEHLQRWIRLTIPIAILGLLASGSGLFWGSALYRHEQPFVIAQGGGQDLMTLGLILPAVLASAFLTMRGSKRALLIWFGLLGYLLYTYTLAAFCLHFNRLFLIYVGLVGCTLYALIGGLSSPTAKEIHGLFGAKTPVKFVSIFFAVVMTLFYLVWLKDIVPALLTGGIPQRVADWNTPTYGVHVLDMAVGLPAFGLTAWRLWRRRPSGYLLAGVLLTFVSAMGMALVAIKISQGLGGFSVSTGRFIIYILIALFSLGTLVWYLRNLKI